MAESVQAYVDGSFIDGMVGYGAVVLRDGESVAEFSGPVTEDTSARQVAGELVATLTVLEWCQQQGIHSIEIFYDYEGIARWALGQWKTNQPLTRRYAETVRATPVQIRWQKVRSHSGDTWNDRADELAKQGALSQVRPAKADSDPLVAVEAVAHRFVDALAVAGIEARYDKIYNQMYARLIIEEKGKRAGFFDLYNTTRRPMSPYLHGFKASALQERIERLWSEFE